MHTIKKQVRNSKYWDKNIKCVNNCKKYTKCDLPAYNTRPICRGGCSPLQCHSRSSLGTWAAATQTGWWWSLIRRCPCRNLVVSSGCTREFLCKQENHKTRLNKAIFARKHTHTHINSQPQSRPKRKIALNQQPRGMWLGLHNMYIWSF